MIKITDLTKSYVKEIKAVDNFKLEVKEGEIFGLTGPNGAGKTTIIKMIVGLLKEDAGKIEIDGITKFDDFVKYKKQFGYVSEEIDMYEKLTGLEFLNFVCDIHKIDNKTRNEKINYYSTLFEIESKLNDYITDYSHGMKQKLMIISSILHEPNLLILDEPFVGLDPLSLIKLKEFINEYSKKGKAIIISTHLLDVAEKICTKVCIIDKGKTLYYGEKEEFSKEGRSLEDIFKNAIKEESKNYDL